MILLGCWVVVDWFAIDRHNILCCRRSILVMKTMLHIWEALLCRLVVVVVLCYKCRVFDGRVLLVGLIL